MVVAEGACADRAQAGTLIAGIAAELPLAGKGHDNNAIVMQAQQQGMQVRIPPRKNCKKPSSHGKHLYKLRHLMESAFLKLKDWRCIATRYAKNVASFPAAVQIDTWRDIS
jgi:transposase